MNKEILIKNELRTNRQILAINLSLIGLAMLVFIFTVKMQVGQSIIYTSLAMLAHLIPFIIGKMDKYRPLVKYIYLLLLATVIGVFFIILGERNLGMSFGYFIVLILCGFYYERKVLVIVAGYVIALNIAIYNLFPTVMGYHFDLIRLISVGLVFISAAVTISFLLERSKKLMMQAHANEVKAKEMVEAIQEIFLQVQNTSVQLKESALLLDSSAGEVSASSQQVAASLDQMAQVIEEQAHDTVDVQKNSGEMNNLLQAILRSAEKVGDISMKNLQSSREGERSLTDVKEQLGEIDHTIHDTALIIKGLGDHSAEIGQIVDLIKDVSDQTNLLALNAAIEAARAGEHGRGFAIVANEIRQLADRSERATHDIVQIIQLIQKKITEATTQIGSSEAGLTSGVAVIHTVTKQYQEILTSFSKMNEQVQQIIIQLDGFAQRNDRIMERVENLAQRSEDNSASVEEVAASMQEQAAMTQTLVEISEKLKDALTNLYQIMQKVKVE